MKRLLVLVLCLCLLIPAAQAELIYAWQYESGEGQSGPDAHLGYVLCESLTVRESPSGKAKALKTLTYGQTFVTSDAVDGWVDVSDESGTEQGWARREYVLVSPAFLVLDAPAKAYAYDDLNAPVLGYLEKGTRLAVIPCDKANWHLVSLRGAAAWIRRTDAEAAYGSEPSGFMPSTLAALELAELHCLKDNDEHISVITDANTLAQLSALLTDAEDLQAAVSGCPFGRYKLVLICKTGDRITLNLAADSCCIYRINERDYKYAVSKRDYINGGPTNEILFNLFDITVHP